MNSTSSASSAGNKKKPGKTGSICVASLNIRGALTSKDLLLQHFLNENEIDVLCLSECNLEGMSPENPFCIRGYKTFCPKLLDTQKYTRVLCLVSEKLDCTLKDEFMDPGISSVWVQLQQSDKGEKTLIGCLYREFKVPAAPGTAATAIQERNKAAQTQRMQIFGSQLSRATAQFKNVFVCGDVNLDLSKIEIANYYNKKLAQELEELMCENGMAHITGFGITYRSIDQYGKVTESEIDNCFSSCPEKILNPRVENFYDQSDHFALLVNMNFKKPKVEKTVIICRDMRAIRNNPALLKDALSKIAWQAVINSSQQDLSKIVTFWTQTLNHVIEKLAPVKERIIRNGNKVKLDKETLELIAKKNSLNKSLLQSKRDGIVNLELLSEFKSVRNHCANVLKAHLKKTLGMNITDESSISEVFKQISFIIKKQVLQGPLKIKSDSGLLEDPQRVAECLNIFFKEKPVKLINKINKDPSIDPNSKLAKKVEGLNLKFSLQPVDVQDVLKILGDLKPKTSCGLDGITSEILKMAKEEIAGPLTIIINKSICSGEFPQEWKTSKLTPVLKKGDCTVQSNYRPVALLCTPSMILEKVVKDQVEKFFEENKLLGQFQFGFRKNKSTISELLTLFETLLEAKEAGKHIGLILYDLSAAFDTVQPSVLVEKLKIYGFDYTSRKWMESYLMGRKQVTTVGGKQSQPVDIEIGTPQGSRLSPLLFLILMADLDLWVEESQLSNFADDTQSVLIADSEEELRRKALKESNAVVSHFSANNLVNNPDKAALLYNNKGKAGNIVMEIAGEEITSVNQKAVKTSDKTEKLLGLQVAPSLDWGLHIEHVTKKLNHRLYLLRRVRDKVPLSKLITVAEAIFVSIIRYGIAVYLKPRLHEDPKSEDSGKLQKYQNKMLRLLGRKTITDKVSSESLSIKFGIMSVNQLATYHYLMETYNIINHGSSEKLQVKLMPKSAHSKSLRVPLVKKTSCRGFGYYAARLWNKLPAKIRISAMNVKSNQKSRLLCFQKSIKDWILGDPVKGIKGGVPFQ